jgi:hypothetical protein
MKTKMKTRFLNIIIFLTTPILIGQTTFQKTYNGEVAFDFGRSVQQTTDGGFIVTGETSLGEGPSDMYLVKTNSEGTIQWAKSFGGAGNEYGYSVQQTSDGGFIVVGNTDTYVAGGPWDMYLVKTTSDGTLQWSKTFGGTGAEEGRSVQETTDGGFIITGYTTSLGAGDVYLVKTASDGTLQWTRNYGYLLGNDFGQAVKQTNDGGFIITGFTTRESDSFDVYLVKTAFDGTLEWTKTFGDALYDGGYDVQQTDDGGFIITGVYENSFPINGGTQLYRDVYLIKTDSNGTLQWNKTFGNTNDAVGYSVQETNDGGYIIGGERSGAHLLKTTSDGTLQWSKTYGNLNGATGKTAAQQTNDGGYIMTGAIINNGSFDVYLIKTDSMGNSGCNETNPTTIVGSGGIQNTGGVQRTGEAVTSTIATQSFSGGIATTLCLTLGVNEITEQQSVSIFPNPTQNILNILTQEIIEEISVYDLLGKKMNFVQSGTNTIDISSFANGMYIIKVTVENDKIISAKFIKE